MAQCDGCPCNKGGFCNHYRKQISRAMPYPDWEFCLQQLEKPLVKHHVFPKGELMRLKRDGRWEAYKP